ncbi:Universal stress protein F [Fasciolopsis buskii]|uniref:Universal stress protein F n=1 Tax=Fasciolopsis buskii TaxID=27845 RepID=A0A8E0VMG6_9TREM|nr:Universal stress protein F [Fasciolopsis buski]
MSDGARPSVDFSDSDETQGNDNLSEAERRVLMPVDGSEHSERAFNWYMENIMRPGDGLYLAHIVEPASPGINYGIASKSPAMKDDFARHMNKLVESGRALRKKFLSRCETLGLAARFTIHVGTKPGEHIVRLAHDQNAQMIVVGNRGIGTVRRTFLGSVSDHILHNANVPVIVVPPAKVSKKK